MLFTLALIALVLIVQFMVLLVLRGVLAAMLPTPKILGGLRTAAIKRRDCGH
ncbi:MAG: hypothetical protein ABI206_11960 [Antricoccus sp.]